MPINYSKWDALELSDDSDIEVHPNVDKRSFIRAKQNQIHQQRFERKHRITTLKYERIVNDGLLVRIDALLKALDAHKSKVEDDADADAVDGAVFECLTDVVSDDSLGEDLAPPAPEGVHSKEQQGEVRYGKMMGALVDQVREEIQKTKPIGKKRLGQYWQEVLAHYTKVQNLQKDLNVELTKLEKEEGGKITSESIHTGFNSSHIAKAASSPPPAATRAAASKTGKKNAEPELLNPSRPSPTGGSDADIEDSSLNPAPGEDEDDEDIQASATGKQFGKIAFGDYRSSLQFIGKHPEILVERETDGLLAEAFTAQLAAKTQKDEDYARQCIHQALLLQYCRQLGKDGVGLFFQRVQTPNHQARKLFLDDVNSTYARIRTRTAELKAAQQEADESGDKEQIQLHAVDPNTTINIAIPPPLDQCQSDDEKESRQIFESFPPGLQRALESGSLDRVNEVLGKMSVDEAELVVEQLGNGGMLSLEQGVIDATTEEGKRQMEEIERTKKMPGEEQTAVEHGQQEPADSEKLSVDEVD